MNGNPTRIVLVPALLGIALLAAAASPAGAISVFDEVAINAALTGRGQSPPVATTAAGQCTGRLVVGSGSLSLTCSNNVAGAGRLILTEGSPSAGGAELHDLGSGPVAGGTATLSDEEVAKLLAGELYAAVTSGTHPSGEIAARLVPVIPMGHRLMRFPLLNSEMVQTSSAATGAGVDCPRVMSRARATATCSPVGAAHLRSSSSATACHLGSGISPPFETTGPTVAPISDMALWFRYLGWRM